jgi:hypothetical protein
MIRLRNAIAASLVAGASSFQSGAQQFVNPANCHMYFLTPTPMTWTDAQAAAVAAGGNLVTVRSAEENAWIMATFCSGPNADRALWIGLTDQKQEGTFVWISGDPSAYRYWNGGEPNNSGCMMPPIAENYAAINWHTSQGYPNVPGTWNDCPDAGVVHPFPAGPGGCPNLLFGLVELMSPCPVVPGFDVDEYASVDKPQAISFAPDGTMFVGWGGEGFTAHRIHRVDIGGNVTEYGLQPLADPDAVLFDAGGSVSGVAGSVLVGGQVAKGQVQVWAIHPDQTTHTLWLPPNALRNPIDMAFDSDGRLLLADEDFPTGQVLVSQQAQLPTLLYSIPSAMGPMALDQAGNIYTSAADGVVRKHLPNGTAHPDNPVASNMGDGALLAVGPGGRWGRALLMLNRVSGTLYRLTAPGTVETIGYGFTGGPSRMAFGPDHALYVSLHEANMILRVGPDCPADINTSATVDVDDLIAVILAWGDCPAAPAVCAADIDFSGSVDVDDLIAVILAWGSCQ